MSAWSNSVREWADVIVRHVFPQRRIASSLLAAGVTLLLAAASGWAVDFSLDTRDGRTSFRFATGEGTPAALTWGLAALGMLLVLPSAWILVGTAKQELRERREAAEERSRRRVIVIEQRGLQVRLDSPLVDAVPATLEGRRLGFVLDHGQMSATGVADRGRLFEDAKQVRRDIRKAVEDTSPSQVSIVYGGISPVPMTFLAGVALEDEGAIAVMDWDRTAGRWRELDGGDDGERFLPVDLSNVPHGTAEVMLAVSVSYELDLQGVADVADGNPVVQLRLSFPRVNNHWSRAKQDAWVEAFRGTLDQLEGVRVQRIHLFLAAPNSVVFRFGKSYNGRLHPEIVVYQYERSGEWRFPWGLRMPSHGSPEPAIVANDHHSRAST